MERAEAHPQSPSARYAKYVEGLKAHALRSAEQRAAADRKEHDKTEYHRTSETEGA